MLRCSKPQSRKHRLHFEDNITMPIGERFWNVAEILIRKMFIF
nr:MAG TPA: hypothetical protein [Caudoviricetes sp.]